VTIFLSQRRAATVGLLLVGAALAGPSMARAADAGELAPREVVVQDDAELLHRSAPEVRRTLRNLARSGTTRVRITAGWSALAPEPQARRRPRFDERDSRRYARDPIARLDRAIVLARAAGLEVQMDLAFWAPRWAVSRPLRSAERQRWRPDVRRYGRFVTAIARRYSGRFDDPRRPGRRLPAVRQWTTWNEPNHAGFLLPQWERVDGVLRPASPHHYRRMHEAGYAAIKRVDARNAVLIGGLASRGSAVAGERRGMQPLRFLRELACVDDRLEPLTDERCSGFAALRADGFAYHPYTLRTRPDARSTLPDEVGIGELGRLSDLLGALHARGRIEHPLELYLTEYGYETNPPDPTRGVNPRAHARYLGLAAFLAWQRPDVRMFPQFLVRDIGPDLRFAAGTAGRWRDFQTGLLDFRGRTKPAARAFVMPFWTYRDGADIVIFGQVRPGGGGHTVRIERQSASGRWGNLATRPATTASAAEQFGFVTDAEGFFVRRVTTPQRVRLRARWLRPTHELSTSTDLVVR